MGKFRATSKRMDKLAVTQVCSLRTRPPWFMVAFVLIPLIWFGNQAWAQSVDAIASPYIYRINASDCRTEPAQRIQSGFRVEGQVGVVTALHGVLGCDVISAANEEGAAFHGLTIVQVDVRHDVALLWSGELADAGEDGLEPFDDALVLDPDERFQMIGYPLGTKVQRRLDDIHVSDRTTLGGLLDGKGLVDIDERNSPGIDIDVYVMEANLSAGHSGAPLLNTDGQVVGIGDGGLPLSTDEVAWAIPWDAIDLRTISSKYSLPISRDEYLRVLLLRANSSAALFAYDTEDAIEEKSRETGEASDEEQSEQHRTEESGQAEDGQPSEPTATANSSPASPDGMDLKVLGIGLTESTYSIVGEGYQSVAIGDDLLVLAALNPGNEIAIALLKVTAKNPTGLTAQARLVHPDYIIRSNMRVETNLEYLSRSQLVPVYTYADGYILCAGQVRLRPDHDLEEEDLLQELEPVLVGGEVIDAFPSGAVMEIIRLGLDKQVANVKLIVGEWPADGSVVALVEPPTPTPTSEPTATQTATPTATVDEEPQLCAFSFLVMDNFSLDPITGATVSVILGTQQDTGPTDSNGFYKSQLPCQTTQQSEARVRVHATGYGQYSSHIYLIDETKTIFLDRTETPTPQATPTTAATPTPTPNSARFDLGDWVEAAARSRLREDPGTSTLVMETLARNEIFRIDGGPVERDGYQWWQVRELDGTVRGWIAYTDEDGDPSLLLARQATPTPDVTAAPAPAPTTPPRAQPTTAAKPRLEITKPHWGDSMSGPSEIRWQYDGVLGANQGFDFILSYEFDPIDKGITGIDKIMQNLINYGNGEYGVTINVSAAPHVQQYCNSPFLLYVVVVNLNPYEQTDIKSEGVDVRIRQIGGDC